MDTQYYGSGCHFICSIDQFSTNRTVEKRSDVNEYDPAIAYTDGNLLAGYPNIRFYYYPEESGSIQGVVTENGNPVSDVLIEIEGTPACTLSDENGVYTFNQAYAGTYNLKASKPGFIDTVIENIEVQNYETTTADIIIAPIPPVNVSGYVFGNNNPEVGLEGATVILLGENDYETITQADGGFSFSGIPANGIFNISVTEPDYYDYSGTILVNDSDLILDDIILIEYAYSVSNLRAGYNEDITEVYLLWDAPQYVDRNFEFYRIYRLIEYEISNPENWEWLADEYNETSYTDSTFGAVEPSIYKFAIVAVYSNENLSSPSFVGPYFEQIFSPTELVIEEVGEQGLSINWEAPDFGEDVINSPFINKPDDFDDSNTRDLFAYNIYLDNILYEPEVTATSYTFDDIDLTIQHQLGVSSLYESGFESEITTILYDPVHSENEMIPELKNKLGKNYPNPFNPTTTIFFSTEQNEQYEQIEIEIFNIKGQKIRSFSPSSCHPDAGSFVNFGDMQKPDEGRGGNTLYSLTWNGTDQNNNPVSSGLYLYKLKVGNKTVDTKKMMLIK